MSVPSLFRIERGKDGARLLKLYKGHGFARKLVNINVSRSAVLKQALVPASPYNFHVKSSYVTVYAEFH